MPLLIGIISAGMVAKWKGKVIVALIENLSSIVEEFISQIGFIVLVHMLIKHPDVAEDMGYIKEIKKILTRLRITVMKKKRQKKVLLHAPK